MRLIAVNQHKMLCRNRLLLSPEIQQEISFLNIGQQKTVKGTSFQDIPRLISKQPALQRVKEHFLRGFAG